MSKIREFASMPKVIIDGKEFIDKKLFIEYARELILEERKDCTLDEQTGIDIALKIFQNLK